MKKMKKYLTLALAALLSLLCLTGCGRKKVDVLTGMEVRFSGMDGEGTAEVVFPDADLTYGFIEELILTGKEDMNSLSDLKRLDRLERAVDYEVTPSRDLSNGDTVTVEVTVDKEALKDLGYSAKSVTMEYTVEGLTVPQEVDAFRDYQVSFTGPSPEATLEFERSREIDGATVTYSCDTTEHLRLGNTVTVTARVSDPDLYTLKETTKEFPVEGVDARFAHAEDIPEGLWQEMKDMAESRWEQELDQDKYYLWTYTGFDYVGYEFWAIEEGFYGPKSNDCYLVYEVTVNDGEEDFSYYYYYHFENLVLRTDGTWDKELSYFFATPGFGQSFRHNVISVTGYETVAELHENIAGRENYGRYLETNLPQ